jgi:hypothetical protein
MKSQLTFSPDVLTCCTLYNHCDYSLTLLVTYECLNILKNNLALMTIHSYNIHAVQRRGLATPQSLVPLYPVQPEEDWQSLRAWFLSKFLLRFLPF